jgi:hypothetical protein
MKTLRVSLVEAPLGILWYAPDEECTVVTVLMSESTRGAQVDSVKVPWTVTGAVVA